jgi:hypothetical protein
VNFVNNYYKPGPSSTDNFIAFTLQHESIGLGTQQAYFAGNVMPGHFDENSQELGRHAKDWHYETWVDTPFFPSYVKTQTAYNSYKNVLSNVGANQPAIDSHDIRVIHETLTGTAAYQGSITGLPGLPDKESDVGGWETFPEEHRNDDWDSDSDGLPNWWERLFRLNIHSAPGDFSDANKQRGKNSFTQLEDYLEFVGGPHYMTGPFRLVTVDLAALTRGYSNRPVYTIDKTTKGFAFQLQCINGKLFYVPLTTGLCAITFTVRDAEGSTMTRTIRIASIQDSSLFSGRLKFDGERKDMETVALHWENERDGAGGNYLLQRSFSPNGPFTTVATIKSKLQADAHTAAASYQTPDANSYGGDSYYKLVFKGASGDTLYSDIRMVPGSQLPSEIKVWPVPSTGQVHLSLTNMHQPVNIRIYNINGTIISRDQKVAPGAVRSFNIRTTGTYIVKGFDAATGEEVFVKKIVIQ